MLFAQDPEESSLEALLKALDGDGDGLISYDDFVLQFDALVNPAEPEPEPQAEPEPEDEIPVSFLFYCSRVEGLILCTDIT